MCLNGQAISRRCRVALGLRSRVPATPHSAGLSAHEAEERETGAGCCLRREGTGRCSPTRSHALVRRRTRFAPSISVRRGGTCEGGGVYRTGRSQGAVARRARAQFAQSRLQRQRVLPEESPERLAVAISFLAGAFAASLTSVEQVPEISEELNVARATTDWKAAAERAKTVCDEAAAGGVSESGSTRP
jgi:hypothetical protein